MNITITDDATDEILDCLFAHPRFHESMKKAGQTIHADGILRSKKTHSWNGTTFTEITSPASEELIDLPSKAILVKLLRELEKSGYPLSLHVEPAVNTKQGAYELVNLAASAGLNKYVSHGKFTPIEYQFVESDVKAWRTAGSSVSSAPESLQSAFDNSDFLTIEEAAVEIESAASLYRVKVNQARRLRLEARKAIKEATGDLKAVITPFISSLKAL